jgi:hypothetical protein
VPLGLPNVVTTPMLRVDTMVVEPRTRTVGRAAGTIHGGQFRRIV